MKKKVLFVGEHPLGTSGNSGMLRAQLEQVDTDKFDVSCIGIQTTKIDSVTLLFNDYTKNLPFKLATPHPEDAYAGEMLLQCLKKGDVDVFVLVGIDIWRYAAIIPKIEELRRERGFKWVAIVPYDSWNFREDWADWISRADYPCIYSQYGYGILKSRVPHARYYRPMIKDKDYWHTHSEEDKRIARTKFFPGVPDENLIFGFIGGNQYRKDPLRLIRAFMDAKKEYPNMSLYLHTSIAEVDGSPFNLAQFCVDCGYKTGDILSMSRTFSASEIRGVYAGLDCLVNVTLQEGLSWTVLEAMGSGVPVIASDSTAHTELVKDVGLLLKPTEFVFIPVLTASGSSMIESRAVPVSMIKSALVRVATDLSLRQKMSQAGLLKFDEWLKGVSNVNDVLNEAVSSRSPRELTLDKEKIDGVLFAQHSSAGDVLMTTKCFRGLKQRHPDLKLSYMTSEPYMDIVKGNPYIDGDILPWDDKLQNMFRIVYNPHATRILPGHWGRNCNSILSDFYWNILMVDPDEASIQAECPKDKEVVYYLNTIYKDQPICVLHTTGGDPHFRMYKFMRQVAEGLKSRYVTVQVGSRNDYPAGATCDFRGKLSFRETAYVMNQASMAVTVDSFVSHLAGALGVSQVCLFGSGNYMVCRPDQVDGTLVCLVPDYIKECPGLGPCSQSFRDCPIPCTGFHDPETILSAIDFIESKEKEEDGKAACYYVQHAKRKIEAREMVRLGGEDR